MKTEKRYTLKYKNHDGSCVILDNGKRLSSDEILDLLIPLPELIQVEYIIE